MGDVPSAIGWIAREDYDDFLKVVEDPDNFPTSYEEFDARHRRLIVEICQQGLSLTLIRIRPKEISDWCKKQGRLVDSRTRMEYALFKSTNFDVEPRVDQPRAADVSSPNPDAGDEFGMPQTPTITEADLQVCRKSGDFCSILFKWYNFVGGLCNFFARIRPVASSVPGLPPLHLAVLKGLLNRCSRLMLANVALSHQGLFGETTAILDRCIFESCVKARWLCKKGDVESFQSFVADGLRTEIELKNEIEKNISARGGDKLKIESRMLDSIANCLVEAELTEAVVQESPKLPDLAAMIKAIGRPRLYYTVGQRIQSHHVHGTWVSLRLHFLQEVDGVLVPRDHDCQTHVNQYVYVPLVVLDTMESFASYILTDGQPLKGLLDLVDSTRGEILRIDKEVVGDDFGRLEGL